MGWTLRLYKATVQAAEAARSWRTTLLLRTLGVKVGRNVRFGGPVTLRIDGDPRRIEIADNVRFAGRLYLRNRENGAIRIGPDCAFDDALRLVAARDATIAIGARTAAGKNIIINAGADVTIGEDCLFSSHINIHSSQHRCLAGQPVLSQGYVERAVTVGRGVWLASNVNILFGTRLGHGVAAAPNTLLAGTYPDDSILVGCPAVIVSQRRADLGPLDEMTDPDRYVSALFARSGHEDLRSDAPDPGRHPNSGRQTPSLVPPLPESDDAADQHAARSPG